MPYDIETNKITPPTKPTGLAAKLKALWEKIVPPARKYNS